MPKVKYKKDGERKFIIDCPHIALQTMKRNSMRELDNFTSVLNRLADSEAMLMKSARLLYMYYNIL